MTVPIVVTPPARSWRRAGGMPLVALAVAAIVGFLAVSLAGRSSRAERRPLAAESEADLARILADLNTEADALQAEVADLKVQLSELKQSSQSAAAADAATQDRLRTLSVLAGTVAVTGPGITVTVADPDAAITYDAMIDVVQELRDAGAEALAINGQRVGVASAFGAARSGVLLDGALLSPPYRIEAIGQPATLEGGLKIPGGAIDAMTAIKGVTVNVARQARVDIPALTKPPVFKAGRPVASDS